MRDSFQLNMDQFDIEGMKALNFRIDKKNSQERRGTQLKNYSRELRIFLTDDMYDLYSRLICISKEHLCLPKGFKKCIDKNPILRIEKSNSNEIRTYTCTHLIHRKKFDIFDFK